MLHPAKIKTTMQAQSGSRDIPVSLGDAALTPLPPRSSAEIQSILSKLRLMAKQHAPYPDLKVVARYGGGWACGLGEAGRDAARRFVKGELASLDDVPADIFRPRQIRVDLKDIQIWPEQRIVGVQSHEIGHATHSNYKLFLEGQARALREGNLPSSWAVVFNGFEDTWIHNLEMNASDQRRAALVEFCTDWVAKHQSGVEEAPLLKQLALNAIHYWATWKNIPTITDPRVLEAWAAIKDAAERYARGVSAHKNFELFQREVWPIAKALEEANVRDKVLNELHQRLDGKGTPLAQSQGDRTNTSANPKKKGFLERVTEWFRGDSKDREENEINKAVRRAQKKSKNKPQGSYSGKSPTPEDRKALGDILDRLKPEIQKKLEDRACAREVLDKEQSDFQNEAFDGPLPFRRDERDGVYKPHAPCVQEAKSLEDVIKDFEQELAEAEEAEAQLHRRQEIERLEREARRISMQREGFDPDSAAEHRLYDRYKFLERSISSYIAPFVRSLQALLPKEREVKFQGAFISGPRIDVQAIARRVPVKDFRIHQRPTWVESPRPKMFIELLIDNSMSMSGEKMDETLCTTIFWSRVLKIFEIPFAIRLFGTEVVAVKDFNQDFDDPRERIKFNLIRKADASMGGTDIGEPLIRAKNEMLQQQRHSKNSLGAIFVLSDSGANQGLTGAQLAQEAQTIARRFVLTNFILTHSASEIEGAEAIFGKRNVVAPRDFTQLCPHSIRVLRGTLDSFRRKLNL